MAISFSVHMACCLGVFASLVVLVVLGTSVIVVVIAVVCFYCNFSSSSSYSSWPCRSLLGDLVAFLVLFLLEEGRDNK